MDELGLTQYATLQPAANFNRLEEVFVVVPQEDAIDLPVEEEETEHPEDGAEPEGCFLVAYVITFVLFVISLAIEGSVFTLAGLTVYTRIFYWWW